YLIGVGIVVAIYTVIQVPFSIYHVATGKRLSCFPEFDFYADKIVSYLLATAVGAGFLVCAELKEESNTQGLGDSKEKYDRFINHGFLASALVLFAFICMAVVSVLSSLNRNSNEKKSIFG
ncbi:CASP-like protein 4D1, partial [Linum grandiflorum]